MNYCCRRSSANRLRANRSPSGAMRPLLSRRFMSLRRNAECSTPFAFRPTGAWNWRSKTSCFARREGPPASPWCATRVFAIRRRAGQSHGASSPRVEHHQGELFPRVGFIVTSMSLPSRSVVRFYNKRGTAEQWIKEGKQGHALDAAVVSSLPGQ